ncbi:MAG TPA: hypothetical protein VGA40_04325 [Candidatus Acidoferrales bacterium]
MQSTRTLDSGGWLALMVMGVIVVGFAMAASYMLPFVIGAIVLGFAIAVLIRERSKLPPPDEAIADLKDGGRRPMPIFGPQMVIQQRPVVTGHPVGLLIAVVFMLILLFATPVSAAFVLALVLCGLLIWLVQWLRHR